MAYCAAFQVRLLDADSEHQGINRWHQEQTYVLSRHCKPFKVVRSHRISAGAIEFRGTGTEGPKTPPPPPPHPGSPPNAYLKLVQTHSFFKALVIEAQLLPEPAVAGAPVAVAQCHHILQHPAVAECPSGH